MDNIEKFLLLRLNYEWKNIVNFIKRYSPHIWGQTFRCIWDEFKEYIDDREINVSSEYTLFDECIRTFNDTHLMQIYYQLIDSYKSILGLSCCMPMRLVRQEIIRCKKEQLFESYFDKVNSLLFNSEEESFLLSVDSLNTFSSRNNNPVFKEIIKYVEALYIFELDNPVRPYRKKIPMPDESDEESSNYDTSDDSEVLFSTALELISEKLLRKRH